MTSVRSKIISNLANLKKGTTFTLADVYNHKASNLDTARRRLGELVEEGYVSRVQRGTFKVTSSVRDRKALLS